MRKIKVAQIGIGHDHANSIFATLRNMSEIFDVVGYAEVPEDKRNYSWSKHFLDNVAKAYEGVKKYTVDEILSMSDLDAVAIETFDLSLVKYAQMAADSGLHIHMDKAPGESANEYEKLLSTIKEKNLAFSIGYMYRFNPAVQQMFEKIKSGEIGKIHSIDAEMSCYYDSDKREWLEQFQGGMMQYLGCHLVDLIVRLCGVPDEIIPYNIISGVDGVKAKDIAFAVFKYTDGISTVRSSMLDAGGFVRRHLIVNGEKGSIAISPLERFEEKQGGYIHALSAVSKQNSLENSWQEGKKTDYGVFDRFQSMLAAFAAMVRGERDYEVDLATEARVHRCLLAANGIQCDYKEKLI